MQTIMNKAEQFIDWYTYTMVPGHDSPVAYMFRSWAKETNQDFNDARPTFGTDLTYRINTAQFTDGSQVRGSTQTGWSIT